MAGRRKPASEVPEPAQTTRMKEITKRINSGRAKIKKTREMLELEALENEARGLYKPEYSDQAMRLCLLGYTNEELAVFFEVSFATLNLWVAQVPALKAAVYAGREEADMDVVESMRDMAKDRIHTLRKQRVTKDGDVIEIEEQVLVPANFNAGQLWLTNRQRGRWKMAASKSEAEEPDEIVKSKIAKSQAQRIRESLAELEDRSDTAPE